ncbi:FHA domain-containing protein [Nocardioides sp. GY 10113]|uniref:FHA domain-containing protein n=1 Tax=Nocardioides sp. GY 10113 TaxID=2569761 RepID=UPI0010A80B5F|nr:FHA domain-containing protein [Nocardioides sp. GY 10113]TIC88007.1 FHA domain-containing protein [Nocardioides sp. GY 10113]
MSFTCPSGHTSDADDYCDVCGLPIDAAQPAAPQPAAPVAPSGPVVPTPPVEPAPDDAAATTCPNCSAANPPNALFCEACGYDFTTGTMPRPVSSLDLPVPASPAPPDAPAPSAPSAPVPAAPDQSVPVVPESVAPALEEPWVAEIWIDPDWYAAQDSADPLPSAGVPEVARLATMSVLVGRTSRSRGIHPDLDLVSDTGISRRHCQLTTDGTRWWVEDLGSSNGTYVGSSVAGLPRQPLAPGERREVAAGERIYLGAWTRIVIRRAQPGEL